MQQTKVSSRNYSLDMLKFLLAFLIVIHHSPSPFHDFIQPLTTCAVPVFFMISGYLIFSKEIIAPRIYKNAVRILKIFGGAIILFYLWYWIRHSDPYIPTVKDMMLFVFVNNEPLSGHLWYLAAYAYALFLLAFFASKNKVQWFRYVAIIGLIMYFILDAVHIYKDMPKALTLVYCTRNFFFTAIPMMWIGALVQKQKPQISKAYLYLALFLLGACAIIEMDYISVNHIADVFFFTIPVAITLFLIFQSTFVQKPNFIAVAGEKYSLYIYIIHPITIKLLTNEFGKDTYFVGIMAFVITLVVSIAYVQTKQTIEKLKTK